MQRKTLKEAAAEMNVSLTSVKRWSVREDYRRVWNDVQRQWRESSQATVWDYGLEAVNVMREIMLTSKRDHVRFEAAKAIGDWAGLGQEKAAEAHDERDDLRHLAALIARRKLGTGITVEPVAPDSVPGEVRVLEPGELLTRTESS